MPPGDRRGLSEGVALRSTTIGGRSGSRTWILLLFLLPVALALLFRDFFRESLVVPLLYVLWLGYEYLKSLPQAALWGLFWVGGLAWVLRSGLHLHFSGKPRRGKPEEEEPRGRVEAWRERVLLARRGRGGYGERYLAHHLTQLALQVLADRRQIEPGRLRRALLRGDPDLDLPEEALRVLRMGISRPPEPSPPSRDVLDPDPLLRVLEEELRLTRSERSRGG